ncbi:MAG: hypothetical protein JKY20_02580 [Alphaproteobacteria bacterium]|nr:hypothetical protein [Alphaproteobacteria bacterium]
MLRFLIVIVSCIILSACMGSTGQRDSWREVYDEEPVYDYYFGDAGNPVDNDPVFHENNVLYAD